MFITFFSAEVGNPPFVKCEALSPLSALLRTNSEKRKQYIFGVTVNIGFFSECQGFKFTSEFIVDKICWIITE